MGLTDDGQASRMTSETSDMAAWPRAIVTVSSTSTSSAVAPAYVFIVKIEFLFLLVGAVSIFFLVSILAFIGGLTFNFRFPKPIQEMAHLKHCLALSWRIITADCPC